MKGAVTLWEIIWTGGLPHLCGFPATTPPSCQKADQRKSTLYLTQEMKERAISRKKLDSETDRSERYRIRKYVTDLGRTASEVNAHFSSQATRTERG